MPVLWYRSAPKNSFCMLHVGTKGQFLHAGQHCTVRGNATAGEFPVSLSSQPPADKCRLTQPWAPIDDERTRIGPLPPATSIFCSRSRAEPAKIGESCVATRDSVLGEVERC